MINMADREDLQTPFDRQRAVSLLEEATQFLREYSGGSFSVWIKPAELVIKPWKVALYSAGYYFF